VLAHGIGRDQYESADLWRQAFKGVHWILGFSASALFLPATM
jgi:hypothetical protein